MPIPDRSHHRPVARPGLKLRSSDRTHRSEEHMATHTSTDTTAADTGRPKLAEAPSVDLTTAYNDALAWWDAYDALGDLDLGTNLEDVIVTARRLGVNDVRDLHSRAAEIIRQTCGVDSITEFTTSAAAERLHCCRNA